MIKAGNLRRMRTQSTKIFGWIFPLYLVALPLLAHDLLFDPIAVVVSPCPRYSLINSVDFHPSRNLFCIAYWQCDRVVLYSIDSQGHVQITQTLANPTACLCKPQHAVFSSNGDKIFVANWKNQTINVYQLKEDGLYCETPTDIFPIPSELSFHRPHGMAISPCGQHLAIAYGAEIQFPSAIALFSLKEGNCKLVSFVQNELPGKPKGITFSPDGTCLLVTFSDVNSLAFYKISDRQIRPIPYQTLQGGEISRPEDVKISPDGKICAMTNSDLHTVGLYAFDPSSNRITERTPISILKNNFTFPHGIAFSSDGSFLVVTEFGAIWTNDQGGMSWNKDTPAEEARFQVFRLTMREESK